MAPTPSTPDAIHIAAEQLRVVKHRFLLPWLEMSDALDAASETILAIGEAEQRRARLQEELAALGADVATRRAETTDALIALTVEHDTALATLGATYAAKHATLEQDFARTVSQRQATLAATLEETSRQITEATTHLTEVRREQAEALKAHQHTLKVSAERADQHLQEVLTRTVAADKELRRLDARVRELRSEAQREATRLRELADRAG